MRDSGPLLLTAGEGHTSLSDKCVIAGGETLDRVIDARNLCCPADLVHIFLMSGDSDIFGERAREEEGLLQNNSEVHAQVVLFYIGYIYAADRDSSAVRSKIIEVIKEIHERRLARTGPAEDSER